MAGCEAHLRPEKLPVEASPPDPQPLRTCLPILPEGAPKAGSRWTQEAGGHGFEDPTESSEHSSPPRGYSVPPHGHHPPAVPSPQPHDSQSTQGSALGHTSQSGSQDWT